MDNFKMIEEMKKRGRDGFLAINEKLSLVENLKDLKKKLEKQDAFKAVTIGMNILVLLMILKLYISNKRRKREIKRLRKEMEMDII